MEKTIKEWDHQRKSFQVVSTFKINSLDQISKALSETPEVILNSDFVDEPVNDSYYNRTVYNISIIIVEESYIELGKELSLKRVGML